MFSATQKEFGKLDILVNNAGIYEFSPIESITEEHFYKQFDLNVLGLILTVQEAIKHFGPAHGSVINISSVVSMLSPANASVYSATKATVDAVTSSLATEGLHAAGVVDGGSREQIEAQTPLGRGGQPQDIAPAVVFLASSD